MERPECDCGWCERMGYFLAVSACAEERFESVVKAATRFFDTQAGGYALWMRVRSTQPTMCRPSGR